MVNASRAAPALRGAALQPAATFFCVSLEFGYDGSIRGEIILMLHVFSPKVAVALTRAREARDEAAAATVDLDRQFWRELEHRWMLLAQGYEDTERLNAFIAEQRSKKH
jgi:hypothetical protein